MGSCVIRSNHLHLVGHVCTGGSGDRRELLVTDGAKMLVSQVRKHLSIVARLENEKISCSLWDRGV
jgi:hypothetical protein